MNHTIYLVSLPLKYPFHDMNAFGTYRYNYINYINIIDTLVQVKSLFNVF
jgi:hypothetical protein